MANIIKKLHSITIDEMEHLRDLNRETLEYEDLEHDDRKEREELDREFDAVLSDPTSGTFRHYHNVLNALEDLMNALYYESSKERTAIRNDLIAAEHIKVKKRAPAPVRKVETVNDRFTYNDGGRSLAGFRGNAGDCVCRAVVIASERPYREVYDRLAKGNASQRKSHRAKNAGVRSARNGIYVKRKWFKDYMAELGFVWVSTMGIGTGCKVHFKREELPAEGKLIVSLSKHYSTMIDGVIHDTYDPSRDGTRCVYGYWLKI